MHIGNLLARTARLVREHPFMPILGTMIVVLSGGELNRLANLVVSSRRPDRLPALGADPRELLRSSILNALAPARAVFQWVGARFGPAGLAGLIIGFLLLAIAIGVLILVARGGLIAATDEIASTGESSFGAALRRGRRRAWRLIIIASIPPIPITAGAILVVIIATVTLRQTRGLDLVEQPAEVWDQLGGVLAIAALCMMLPLGLITFVLGLLRHLADRACVLESRGVIASYQRGWEVFRQHPGEMLLLLLIHAALQFGVWVLLLVPRALIALCAAFLLPIWVVLGIMKAYFIVLWTLAWREWTLSPDSAAAPSDPPNLPV